MGTNFYLKTKVLALAEKYTDAIETEGTAYLIHIAKTSGGWLPLFEEHKAIHSVADLLEAAKHFDIVDEYDNFYSIEAFIHRVLEHNGGYYSKAKIIPALVNKFDDSYEKDDCDRPISNLEFGNGKYKYDYYRDAEGYEFSKDCFI